MSFAGARAALGKTALKSIFGAVIATGVLSAGEAQALQVNVGGVFWGVTTFNSSYTLGTSKFNTPANGGVMPWWGNSTLANMFATAENTQLGSPNPVAGVFSTGGPGSPYFGWTFGLQSGLGPYTGLNFWIPAGGSPAEGLKTINVNPGVSYEWAQASLTVPGPLPVFGVAAAFGFSRKLRKRITANKAIGAPIIAE
jgi:hypothetical protein